MADDETNKQQDELELQAGDKKLRIRGSDILGILTLVGVSLIAYGGWEHKADAKEEGKEQTAAIKDNTNRQWQAQMQTVNALREANCLNRLTQKQKENFGEINYCKQLGEGR